MRGGSEARTNRLDIWGEIDDLMEKCRGRFVCQPPMYTTIRCVPSSPPGCSSQCAQRAPTGFREGENGNPCTVSGCGSSRGQELPQAVVCPGSTEPFCSRNGHPDGKALSSQRTPGKALPSLQFGRSPLGFSAWAAAVSGMLFSQFDKKVPRRNGHTGP